MTGQFSMLIDSCGAGMTLSTGKGGRYRYYKCNTRISKGNKLCDGRSIPMEKLDSLILTALADKVFDPNRVKIMLSNMKKQIKAAQESQDDGLKKLTKELNEIKIATSGFFIARTISQTECKKTGIVDCSGWISPSEATPRDQAKSA